MEAVAVVDEKELRYQERIRKIGKMYLSGEITEEEYQQKIDEIDILADRKWTEGG